MCAFMDALMETFSSAHLCSVSYTLTGERRMAGGKGGAAGCHTGVRLVYIHFGPFFEDRTDRGPK